MIGQEAAGLESSTVREGGVDESLEDDVVINFLRFETAGTLSNFRFFHAISSGRFGISIVLKSSDEGPAKAWSATYSSSMFSLVKHSSSGRAAASSRGAEASFRGAARTLSRGAGILRRWADNLVGFVESDDWDSDDKSSLTVKGEGGNRR